MTFPAASNNCRRFPAFLLATLCLVMSPGCGAGGGSGCGDDYDCPASQICVGETDDTGAVTNGGHCETFVCKTDDDCVEPGVVCELNVCTTSDENN